MKDHLKCYHVAQGLRAFPGQSADEKVALLIRKYWIVDVGILVKIFFAVFWPWLLYAVFSYIWRLPTSIYFDITVVFVHIYTLFALFFYYVKWIDHRFDLIIFTDRRMVDINQTRLFDRKVSEANLAQIQDVSSEVKGFWGTILHYGTLKIQTAGPDGNIFEMSYIHWPNLVASTIIELRDGYSSRQTIKGNPQSK